MASDRDRCGELIDSLPEGILRCSPVFEGAAVADFVVEDANAAMSRILGRPLSELKRKPRSAIMTSLEKDRDDWIEPYARVALDGKSIVIERHSRATGRWYEVTVCRDVSGCIVVVAHDIAEYREVREALRKSEQRYRSLFEQSIDAVFTIAPDGTGIEPNQAWLELFGYSREDLSHLSAVDFYADPRDRETFLRQMEASGYVRDVVRLRRSDGSCIECERSVVALKDESGRVILFEGLHRDITERNRVEQALRESEQRYRALFEQSLDAIYIVSPDGTSIEANQAWLDLFGYTREELAGLNAVDVYADPRDRVVFLEQIAATGRVQDVVRLKRRDGSTIDCERSVVALRDASGAVKVFQGLQRDITQRKRAEEALRESEAAARALLDATTDAACLMEPTGKILALNEEMARRLRGASADLIGERIWDHLPPEVARRRRAKVEEVVQLRRPVRFEDERDGRRIDTSFSPITNTSGEVVRLAVFGRDVTEERRAEQQLRDSREELRSLAARQQNAREDERLGIARELHDELGQYLTVLKMDLHHARKQRMSGSSPEVESLAGMIEVVDRMAEDVRRISSELRPGVLDDFGLVAAMEWQVAQFRARTGIRCELETTVDDFEVDRVVSTVLFRVFQELLTNVARHAHAHNVQAGLARADGGFILTVSDDGIGITKAQEESHASLGLIGMRERVRPFGGRVEFERGTSGGTIARAIIPASARRIRVSREADGSSVTPLKPDNSQPG